MGGFQWIRKKLQKVDGVRKGAKRIFGGKKQKDDRFNLLDQEELEDDLDYDEIGKGYRNILATLNQLKNAQDQKEPEQDFIEEAQEPPKSDPKYAGQKIIEEAQEPPKSDPKYAGQKIIEEAQEPPKSEPKYAGQKMVEEAMEDLKDEYTFEAILGTGTYGSVCHLFHKGTEQQVAAKIVLKEKVGDYEIDLWAILEHPHILPLLKTFETAKYQVFLSPIKEGSLEGAVKNRKLTFAQLRHYLQGAFQGLNYLHVNGMCHLDVKGNNVLIGGGNGIICDFGFLAPKTLDLKNDCVGMPDWYRPPEASFHYGLDAPIPSGEACDQWGCGIMLMELCSDFPILRAKPEERNWLNHVCPVLIKVLQPEVFVARVQSFFSEVDSITALLLHLLIMDFLEINPEKRSTIQIALQHEFFEEQSKP
ncbi:hypothetical protein JTE90_022934 [Oedothorax gibbosus]|uniref:Protein kinase domain-containing protein n=1 Tax=Oedothorax gibbosus TaxID=931172 RepID=A0AAV6U724_9ARAC|nr:hypothetical protein JTE90_022934 [Oedothorax gibbosus]